MSNHSVVQSMRLIYRAKSVHFCRALREVPPRGGLHGQGLTGYPGQAVSCEESGLLGLMDDTTKIVFVTPSGYLQE